MNSLKTNWYTNKIPITYQELHSIAVGEKTISEIFSTAIYGLSFYENIELVCSYEDKMIPYVITLNDISQLVDHIIKDIDNITKYCAINTNG